MKYIVYNPNTDSLCIDQGDHSEKDDQIQRMRSIYRGAYVTIIALSGDSANSGLPKVSGTEVYQQLTCCIDGKRLVGLMPTLSLQVWLSPWGQRAWTFQESRLSPRCLLISNHQLYFKCKGMNFIESLEHKRSWVHNLSVSSNPTNEGFATWMMDQGGAGCFRHVVDASEHRLHNYGCGVNLYSCRKVKYAEDCLKAFTGMLQTFENVYPRGFIEGLPIEDLDWGLLWHSRDPSPRRTEFPSWCWAGWEGAVWYGHPIDHTKPRRFPINLDIQRINGKQLELLFHTSIRIADTTGMSIVTRNDPVDKAQRQDLNEPEFCFDVYPEEIQSQLLVIHAVTFNFMLDFSMPRHRTRGSGQYGFFKFPVRKTTCFIRIISTDNETSSEQNTEKMFILIARDFYNGFIVHYLLLIYIKNNGSMAERGTALALFVPLDHLDILDELKPRRKRIVLA
jgi:hypothetical protein